MTQDGSDPRTDENGDALRRLTARLLTAQNVDDERAAPPPRISVGHIPENLPVQVTIPHRAEVVGVVERDLDWRRRGAEIVLDVPLSAERFREAYRQQLLAAGWEEDEDRLGRRGFVPSGLPGLFHRAASCSSRLRRFLRGRVPGLHALFPIFFRSNETRLMVYAHEQTDAPTDVRLHLTTGSREPWLHDDDAWSAIPILFPPRDVRGRPEDRINIPQMGVLHPPRDAERVGGGGEAWAPEATYSHVVIRTNIGLEALAAHYAARLEGAGWSRSAEGVDGHQAWSAWTLEHKQYTWESTFGALRLAGREGRHSLQIHAVRTEKAGK